MRPLGKTRFRPLLDGLEPRRLLATYAVVEVANQSSYTVTYNFRWTPSSRWSQITESPGEGELFWTTYSSSLTPQVLYDTTTSSSSQTTDTLPAGYGEWTGIGTPTASAAVVYDFQSTATGVQLNPAATVPTDAVVDIANTTSSSITFDFRWTSSAAWTQYTLAAGQSQLLDTTYSSTLVPQVEYDTTSSTSSQTTVSLSNGYGEWTGTGTPPASAAVDYSFETTTTAIAFVYGTGGGGSGTTGLAPNPDAVDSSNWSGYAAATNLKSPAANSVTEVSASWKVPTVTGSGRGTTYSAVWVGIDGYSDDTVEQLGTEQDVVNGKPLYQAWWEMYSTGDGQPEQVISSMTISPGDSISASVQYITSGAHSGQFLLTMTDSSKANDSFSIYETSSQVQSPTAQRSSAEWIVEAPSVGNSIAALANFGLVTFTNASATINGVTGPIDSSSWQSQAINIGGNGTTEDTTSITQDSGSTSTFMVTYGSSNSPKAPSGSPLASIIQTGGTDRSATVLSLLGSSAPATPQVILTGSATPSGYHSLFRPAQAVEKPTFYLS
jgi:Peptidase A4 family